MHVASSPATEYEDLVPLQGAALDIWRQKYQLKNSVGEALDRDVDASLARVARALADLESEDARHHWYERFLWALRQGAIPAGRILSNAGAGAHKPETSTINCTVSATIEDSMDDILGGLHEAGITLKAGCGIGYEFSTLRPRDSYVAGAGAQTSGPLSFMDVYDSMCFTISSAGGRRGAQMATFDVSHPDVEEFIAAKREDGKLRQFNLSLLITEEFMQAVSEDSDWPLVFPLTSEQAVQQDIDLADEGQVLWREWPVGHPYISDDSGRVACRILRTVRARELWDTIMRSTYDYAEPGFILIDRVNDCNNNWFCENIRATNPCGEQPLPPHGSCLLGSVNLTRFVVSPFAADAHFDWKRFREVVAVFTRMLDNVVEINGLALEGQRGEILAKRRHGMGFLGLGSALTMLRMKYGEADSLEFTESVARSLAVEGWREGLALAREKGPAPIMEEEFEITPALLRLRPELEADGFRQGDTVPGRILHTRYSRYMRQLREVEPDLVAALEEEGSRFTHHSSIAPTGTISLSLGNNVSNGIEPSFAHHYARNIIVPGKKSKAKVDVFSYELLAYRHHINPQAMPHSEDEDKCLPDYFISADDITPRQHVDVQAAAQKWVDSSISKTANVPTNFPFEDFKDIYRYAHEKGLKGCTTFRFNPEAFQGVMVKEQDLKNTRYEFTLENGSSVQLAGDEEVEYDGQVHTVANLYDALKEGYYGKF
jgi:ribonucleoside-diphosphate reductase alpha chain